MRRRQRCNSPFVQGLGYIVSTALIGNKPMVMELAWSAVEFMTDFLLREYRVFSCTIT
jgi:hypothetical protein